MYARLASRKRLSLNTTHFTFIFWTSKISEIILYTSKINRHQRSLPFQYSKIYQESLHLRHHLYIDTSFLLLQWHIVGYATLFINIKWRLNKVKINLKNIYQASMLACWICVVPYGKRSVLTISSPFPLIYQRKKACIFKCVYIYSFSILGVTIECLFERCLLHLLLSFIGSWISSWCKQSNKCVVKNKRGL